jgi:hypothetical protein
MNTFLLAPEAVVRVGMHTGQHCPCTVPTAYPAWHDGFAQLTAAQLSSILEGHGTVLVTLTHFAKHELLYVLPCSSQTGIHIVGHMQPSD